MCVFVGWLFNWWVGHLVDWLVGGWLLGCLVACTTAVPQSVSQVSLKANE